MDETIKQLLYDANLIISNHHDGFGSSMSKDLYDLHQRAMWISGWNGYKHDEELWESYIPKLPVEIRSTMIALDDALDMHRFC